MKVHAFRFHLPGIFDERLPLSDSILRQRRKALEQARTWLLNCPGDWDRMLTFVEMQRMLTSADNTSITSQQADSMTAFCHHLRVPVPERFSLVPISSVAVLLHWKALLLIVARLDPAERDFWRSEFPNPQEPAEPKIPEAFDAHFHLDRCLGAMKLKSLDELLTRAPVEQGKEISLVGACASYCDPDTYPESGGLFDLPGFIKVVVGFHPKHSARGQRYSGFIQRLRELLKHPRVQGLGEVGLDHSVPMGQWHDQVIMLNKILPLLERRHVLVLHCRGMDDDNGTEAYMLLRNLLKKTESLRSSAYICTVSPEMSTFSGSGRSRSQTCI